LPLPADPELINAQLRPLVAVQPQPVEVLTEMLNTPPDDEEFNVVGETVKAHAAVGWLMVTVLPATVIVPLRPAPVFAATLI
jgi:hypothetical protein